MLARNGEAWTEEAKLQPPDVNINDVFGASVALNATVALVQSLKRR